MGGDRFSKLASVVWILDILLEKLDSAVEIARANHCARLEIVGRIQGLGMEIERLLEADAKEATRRARECGGVPGTSRAI